MFWCLCSVSHSAIFDYLRCSSLFLTDGWMVFVLYYSRNVDKNSFHKRPIYSTQRGHHRSVAQLPVKKTRLTTGKYVSPGLQHTYTHNLLNYFIWLWSSQFTSLDIISSLGTCNCSLFMNNILYIMVFNSVPCNWFLIYSLFCDNDVVYIEASLMCL